MKKLIEIMLLMLITSINLNAQDFRKITSKSIPASKNMTMNLNLKNSTVQIEESQDGKIHYNFSMEFTGYSKKQIAEALKKVVIKTSQSNEHFNLDVNSDKLMQLINYSVSDAEKLLFLPKKGNDYNRANDTIARISRDSMLNVIRRNRSPNHNQFLQQFTFLKGNDRNNMFNEVDSKRVDIMKSKFVIKIPPFVKLDVDAENSNIYFKGDIQNKLIIDQSKGMLKVNELRNTENSINLNDVLSFEAEKLIGGKYTLKSVKNCNVASTSNLEIKSEFSKIKLTEIIGESTLIDFNSEIFIYNYSNQLKDFYILSDYSKLHLFIPHDEVNFNFNGQNVKHISDSKFYFNSTSENSSDVYIDKKGLWREYPIGNVTIEMENGILYTYER